MISPFIRERITMLRIQKGVSEYKMSLDLGHSKGYIQGITSGNSKPSIDELGYICEYFGISIQEFFNSEIEEPILVHRLHTLSCDMRKEDLEALIAVAERLKAKK